MSYCWKILDTTISFSVNKQMEGTFLDDLFITLSLKMLFILVNMTSLSVWSMMGRKYEGSQCGWIEKKGVYKKRKIDCCM